MTSKSGSVGTADAPPVLLTREPLSGHERLRQAVGVLGLLLGTVAALPLLLLVCVNQARVDEELQDG